MATLLKKIFGDLSGSLGNNIFRNRYGKVIVYQKSAKHRISKSKAAKRSRKTFALIVSFARTIIAENELKILWQKSNLPGTSSYHKIIKYNSAFISENHLTVNNKIIPECTANLILDIILDKKSLTFYFNHLLLTEVNSFCIFVTGYFYNKKFFLAKDFLLKSIKQNYERFEEFNAKDFTFDLNDFFPNSYRDAVIFTIIQINKNDGVIYGAFNKKMELRL